MTVTVLFFAHYQDVTGSREQAHVLPTGATVRALADALAGDYPELRSLLSYARVAVNADYADADTVLRDGDEVALMPPMSGGSGQKALTPAASRRPSPKLGRGWRASASRVRAAGGASCR